VQGPPALVIEVLSKSTRKRDAQTKRRLFERSGVREYWLADPELDAVQVFRPSPEGRLARVVELTAEDARRSQICARKAIESRLEPSMAFEFPLPDAMLGSFCRQHGIARLSLFGSALRDDFGPTSDVDLLVEFLPDRTPGLIRLAGIERELSALIGRKVDLRTTADLSRYFRDRVAATAVVKYAA